MKYLYYIIIILFYGCGTHMDRGDFDIQGHRGCRGLMPENTLVSFFKAIDLGVNTLELDVVITGEGEVLISHDPFIHHDICLDIFGGEIPEDQEESLNIFQMPYKEIRQFDCGSKKHNKFPAQKNVKSEKPLLAEAILEIESYLITQGKSESVRYNIEIKSKKEWDGVFQPPVKDFVDKVVAVVLEKKISTRMNIQSFDLRVLQYCRNKYPFIELALLVDKDNLHYLEAIKELGFTPEKLSPEYHLVDEEMISYCHRQNIKIIPWTVNEKPEMLKLIQLGVDGIITDYPDRLISIF